MKYSIIVPVYNAEKYLDECIGSVLAQTVCDFELLLMDDGSVDGSGKICDKYAALHNNIRVFHNENGGVSAARNHGIDNAVGEYICFLDADDVLQNIFLETAEKALDGSDILIMRRVWSKGELTDSTELMHYKKLKNKDLETYLLASVYRTDDDFKDCPPINCNVITDKIYRRDFLNNNDIRFKEGVKIAEDKLFNFRTFQAAKTAVRISNAHYYLRRNVGSATQRYMQNCFETNMSAVYDIRNMIENYRGELYNKLLQRYKCALFAVERNCLMLDYCSKNNKKLFKQRKNDFIEDFGTGEIHDLIFGCDENLLVPYERYLNSLFKKNFIITNALMKNRVLRIAGYFVYRVHKKIFG